MSNINHENWDFSRKSFDNMTWGDESTLPKGVPLLDFSIMRNVKESNSIRQPLLNSLRDAVTNSGFFYIKNHGISDAELEAIANFTRAFYGCPEEYKCQFSPLENFRGYSGYRVESIARFFGTGVGKDLCMKYAMGPETKPDDLHEGVGYIQNSYAPNIFPNSYFREAWVLYYEKILNISTVLLSLIGDVLDLSEKNKKIWHDMLIEKGTGELRFFQYPDVPLAACADVPGNVEERMAAHFDIDVITLLHQTPCDNGFVSLEAKLGNKYYKLPAIRGALVINLGEIIRLLTGGHIAATIHRVVRPPQKLHYGSARDVTVFFRAPPLEAKLYPILISDDADKYTVFDEFYRLSENRDGMTFGHLRAKLTNIFLQQARQPDIAHEFDAHLFSPPGGGVS